MPNVFLDPPVQEPEVNDVPAVTVSPVTSKGANERTQSKDPTVAYRDPGPQLPPPTRTTAGPPSAASAARRAAQKRAIDQSQREALMVPLKGSAKAAAIAKAGADTVKRFGEATSKGARQKVVQAEHAAQAAQEAVTLAGVKLPPEIGYVAPGTQPTNWQLRQMAKQQDKLVRDEATEAGKIAGKAVRDTLMGRVPRHTPHDRYKKIAEHQAAQQTAQANAKP